MCRDGHEVADKKATSDVRVRCGPLGEDIWVLGLTVGADHPARCNRQLTRFHFVLDNSASMGGNSEHAKQCFADLVALATGPCSLITFDSTAQLLGENFRSPEQFRAAKLPRQGGTNITAGLEMTLEVIGRSEQSAIDAVDERAHHVLVLLSDGAHNRGPTPEDLLPVMGESMRTKFPMLRLSVVVVGVTANSNTSMGMLMKESLETVALPMLDPIYFASTLATMGETLKEMHTGLASLQGSVLSVHAPEGCLFVRAVGETGLPSVDLLGESHEQTLLCVSSSPPAHLQVDGVCIHCEAPPTQPADFDVEFATNALQQLLDAVRVCRVAVGAEGVRPALQQLRSWISALEVLSSQHHAATSGVELCLARATPAQRLAGHKALKRTTYGAKELFNQLAEIEAHNCNDSASQAAFLTGASSKFGAKALRRAAAHHEGVVDPGLQLTELVADITRIAPKMKQALREDFCEKISFLSAAKREELLQRLLSTIPASVSHDVIQRLCAGSVTADALTCDTALAEVVDSGVAVEALLTVTGGARHSYLSLYSAWEQLRDWCCCASDISNCTTEYQLLMCVGAIGYPIDVQRRAATQMDPFAMSVTRVRTSVADTASLLTALHSDQPIVPPEGGAAIEDLLILVDPDAPRASRLAVKSKLLQETYTSVVLCRDLHMYTGNKMRDALHAHAFLSAVQPPPAELPKQDFEAQLKRQYLGRAFQCAQCSFGPIDHFACGDLEAHHGEDVGGATVNNACPRCSWFSESLADWPKWDGTIPKEALQQGIAVAGSAGTSLLTAASAEMALRICYSARALWNLGPDSQVQELCKKFEKWGEPLTAADGVDHPIQLLLATAVVDDLPEDSLGSQGVLALLNEVCARRARDDLRMLAGTDEPAVMAAARKRVAGFLGVSKASAPQARPLEESEPTREAVKDSCCGDYSLDANSFDFKTWVRDVLEPWHRALIFIKRLREVLVTRKGGWPQLAKDMEAGPEAYDDVVHFLQKPACSKDSFRAILGIEKQSEWSRILATIAAQAFLHHSSQLRRCPDIADTFRSSLGDVCDSNTLRTLCVELRMAVYEEHVAEKMREWSRLGASLTCQRARAVDLNEYSHMCGTHVHGLDKPTFWGLWNAATGDKAKEFLTTANHGFLAKHGGSKA